MSRRVDEDGPPVMPGVIREIAGNTREEVVEYRLPLRLPFSRGRRRLLVIRAHTRTAVVTLAVE